MKIVNVKRQSRLPKTGNLLKAKLKVEQAIRRLTLARSLTVYGALFVSIFFIGTLSTAAYAQAEENPLSPKPNLMWLSDDVNVSVFGNDAYDSFLGKSEIWTNNWGVSAKLLQNDNNDVFGLPKDSKFFNFDVKHRVFGSHDASNLELGLGWQELDIDSQLDASGPKVSLSGRYNVLSGIQLYGQTAYFPELEDEIQNTDAKGYEIEAGLLYKPIPSWSLKAGYRVFSLDLQDPVIEELGSSSGFLLGTDLSW